MHVINCCCRGLLRQAMDSGTLNLPPHQPLPRAPGLGPMPYVFVADEGLPLRPDMMRPYSRFSLGKEVDKRVYNYRHSRCRRVVENAFGILVARFRIYERRLNLLPENAEKAVKATVVLHNFIADTRVGQFHTHNTATELPATGAALRPMASVAPARRTNIAMDSRDNFCKYFNSDAGALQGQLGRI